MRNITINYILFILLILCSCKEKTSQEENIFSKADSLSECDIRYAKGFKIEHYANFKLITITDPWQGAKNIQYRYVLADDISGLPRFPEDIKLIKTPVSRVVCLSTTHIAFIDILNKNNSIVGVSGTQYVYNPHVRNEINNHKIVDVGYDNNLNYELIASLKPDLVITYGVGSQVTGYNQKLSELGINTVINAEYLEEHPLGKLEWIKFIAAFYNLGDSASDYFNIVEKQYNELVRLTSGLERKPEVLIGMPWKDTWYVPGGKSYMAKLVEDAGGHYIWSDNESRESLALDIERVFALGQNAEIWLNTGSINNKKEILTIDERFQSFAPYKNGRIFNNNNRINNFGGIDYWESGIVNPHVILHDMISIFHPELLTDCKLVYYKAID